MSHVTKPKLIFIPVLRLSKLSEEVIKISEFRLTENTYQAVPKHGVPNRGHKISQGYLKNRSLRIRNIFVF